MLHIVPLMSMSGAASKQKCAAWTQLLCAATPKAYLLHVQAQAPWHGGLPCLSQYGVEGLAPGLNRMMQACNQGAACSTVHAP